MRITHVLAVVSLALLLASPHDAEAQIATSVAAGVAHPVGDLDDAVDSGFTLRGQAGLSLLVAGLHAQVGYTRFPGDDVGGVEIEDVDFFHAGVGGRLGLGLAWVGLNAAYFTGDGEDGVGLLPEVGVGLGPLEAVADGRLDGDAKWVAVRVGLKL